jgi:hypothetical protein
MSLRTHAVVVHPDRWSKPTAELARLLVPLTGVEIAPLTELLERGPMTVEADLSPTDAKALQKRLAKMGVPAEIQGDEVATLESDSRPPALPGGLPTEEIPRAPAPPRRREVITEEISRPPLTGESTPPPAVDENGVQIPGALEALEGPRATDEIPRRRKKTMRGMAPREQTDTPPGGWGALFPDLVDPGPGASEPETAETPKRAAVPSLDELEGDSDSDGIPPSLTATDSPERRTAELDRDEPPRRRRGTVPGGLAGGEWPGPDTADDAPPSAPQTPAAPRPDSPPTSDGSAESSTPPKEFDGSHLAELLPGDEERPPYAPTGFDPRPEHPPQVAAALSVLAPGAGQVFNGDDEEALAYGLRFWLIKPWVDAVRDAYDKGEKIRTYWAPRPEPGAFVSALKYLAAFWLCVGLSVTLLYFGGARMLELAKREPEKGIGPAEITTAIENAGTQVLGARVTALDAVQEASLDSEPRSQFTMSDEERAERLFALGYVECESRNFSMCEAMMKRVTELKNAHAAAIKLQAWASVSQRGADNEPMPDIGSVPTLSELELQHLRQEMALQGEDVPPPPEKPAAQGPPDAAGDPAEASDEAMASGDDAGGVTNR